MIKFVKKWVLLIIYVAFLLTISSMFIRKNQSSTDSKSEKQPVEWINNLPGIKQDDEALLDVVRREFLTPPPAKSIPYNVSWYSQTAPICDIKYGEDDLASSKFNPSCGQVQSIEDILRKLTPGFFIECGANDGIFTSNTLWLERHLGWSGLLVEADPNAYETLVSVKRKAWLSNTCFSVTPFPKQMTFYINPKYSIFSGLIPSPRFGATKEVIVQCLPLYTTLLAMNRTVIDFFSLDVEGNELEILKTIPFDKIMFKVLAIEHLFIPGGKQALRSFMESKGYIFYRTIVKDSSGDSVYLHPLVTLNSKELEFLGHEDDETVKQHKGKRN